MEMQKDWGEEIHASNHTTYLSRIAPAPWDVGVVEGMLLLLLVMRLRVVVVLVVGVACPLVLGRGGQIEIRSVPRALFSN